MTNEELKKWLNTINTYYIVPDKREEFKQLHLSRFRYEYDEKKNRYFRNSRNAHKKINVIYIDADTWHIYWEYFGAMREVTPNLIIKLCNRGMVEVIRKEKEEK
jgi:hypothetical protein